VIENMAKKSGITFIHDSPIVRTTIRPSGARVKDNVLAPAKPTTSNPAPSADVTGNPYRPDDSGLFGGASDAPKPSNVVHPTDDQLKPGPGVGVPRPDVH
jgi:hypothetical protein